MDRPARKTKSVNYCESKDFNDDEDFACVKAPPSKKPREGSSSKCSSQESNSDSTASQKSRRPLDERLHERDLEAAIVLSLLNNEDGIKGPSPTGGGEMKIQVPADENTDPTSLRRSNCSVDSSNLGLDEITSEKESLAVPRQRKAAAKATKEQTKKFTDEDYEPKLTPDSESDDDFSEPDESEDEEFTVKKISKTKKREKVAKNERTKRQPASKKEKPASKPPKSKTQAAAASTPVRSSSTTKLAPKRPASSSTVPTSKSAFSPSPAGGGIPKWTPPGQIGRSTTSSQSPAVKSPGQGLRLGLSRLVRVKPLHPSVASH